MNVEVRPATKAEQMYCYTQSDQIMGQTGCIGHLRADMGDSGDQFFHAWTSHCERLLTPEFDAEFYQVIRQLREEDGFLKSRAAVSAYCYRQTTVRLTFPVRILRFARIQRIILISCA